MEIISSLREAAEGIANNTLTNVDLTGSKANIINDDDLTLLLAGFGTNTSLKSLDLTLNQITDVGASYLAACFVGNPSCTLQNLVLGSNLITDVGAAKLIVSIPPSLTRLDLSGNKLTDKTLSFLIKQMSENPSRYSIKALLIRDVGLTDEAFKEVSNWLVSGSCPLISLHLSGNPFGDEVTPAIREILSKNLTLTDLNLSNTNINNFKCIFTDGVFSNKSLLSLKLGNKLVKYSNQTIETVLEENRLAAKKKRMHNNN